LLGRISVDDIDTDELLRELRYEDNSITIAAADEIDRLREENADLAMILERLGKPGVNAYRWEDVKRFTDAEAENADLRARLAEVEDDHSRMVEWHDQEHARAEAAEGRLAEVEAERDALRDEIGNLTMHDASVEWRKTEAKLAEVEAERDRLAALVAEYRAESNETWTTIRARAEAAEAEIEFMRAWCADHFGGLMPPTREQNAAFMAALDEMEKDNG
jgi:DNA repair exonuclease SbcCD ATPase subunit